MIDDHPDPCDACGKMSWGLICDNAHENPENGLPLYFCTECCDFVGHQPPFSDDDLKHLFRNEVDIH
jgi:hypothetical protein